MNKKELVETMVQKTWLTTKDNSTALQAFIDVVAEQLQNVEEQGAQEESEK